MIKAVLFDLDNTLYDEFGMFDKALKAAHKIAKVGSFKQFQKDYEKAKNKVQSLPNFSFHNRTLYFLEMLEGKTDYKTILKAEEAYWNVFYKNMKPGKKCRQNLKGA